MSDDTATPKIKHTITVEKYADDDTSGEPIETVIVEAETDAAEWPALLSRALAIQAEQE